MWSTAFRSLDTEVQVTTDDRLTAQTIASLTSTHAAAASSEASLRYRICSSPGPGLFCNDELMHEAIEMVNLPSLFHQDLCRQLIIRCREGWILHSAALSDVGDPNRTCDAILALVSARC